MSLTQLALVEVTSGNDHFFAVDANEEWKGRHQYICTFGGQTKRLSRLQMFTEAYNLRKHSNFAYTVEGELADDFHHHSFVLDSTS